MCHHFTRSGRRTKLSPSDERKLDVQEQPRNHRGLILPWNSWKSSVTVHSEVIFTSPLTEMVPTKKEAYASKSTSLISTAICSCLHELFQRKSLSCLTIKPNSNYKSYVWRNKGEALAQNTVPAVKYGGGGSIMLWNCFASSGTGWLHKVDEIINFVPCLLPNFSTSSQINS